MTDLAAWIEESAASEAHVSFLTDGLRLPLGSLLTSAAAAARHQGRTAGAVAIVMETSPECVATFLGALMSGRTLVSLPPPLGMGLERWTQLVSGIVADTGVGIAYLPAEVDAEALALPAVELATCAEAVRTPGPDRSWDPAAFRLIQLTSGTTGDPRPIDLGLAQLSANVRAILERLSVGPGDVSCSWLPLSHDMGLVGMMLTALVGIGPDGARGSDAILIDPRHFARNPSVWMRACSDLGARITAAPSSAYAVAARFARRSPGIDLSHLRACIVGAEPVQASALRGFAAAFRPNGLGIDAFCPAYGMAEAALAVTMVAPSDPVEVRTVAGLDGGPLRDDPAGVEVVSSGRAVRDTRVTISGADGEVGGIVVEGPSLVRPRGVEGAAVLRTNDLGFVHDGQLYVTGRTDDIVVRGGRNVSLTYVDELVSDAVRCRRCTSFALEDGAIVVLYETTRRRFDPASATRVRQHVLNGVNVSPTVHAVHVDSLPLTTSGKVRRNEARRMWAAAAFAQIGHKQEGLGGG